MGVIGGAETRSMAWSGPSGPTVAARAAVPVRTSRATAIKEKALLRSPYPGSHGARSDHVVTGTVLRHVLRLRRRLPPEIHFLQAGLHRLTALPGIRLRRHIGHRNPHAVPPPVGSGNAKPPVPRGQ